MDNWKIIKKELKDLSVSAVVITNETGEEKRVSIKDVVLLARNNKITNAKASLNTISGNYILNVDSGLSSIETVYGKDNQLEIMCRMINSDNKCIGYKVKDSNDKVYKLSLSKIWELASKNIIYGIRAGFYGDKKCIVNKDDYKIENVPILNV